MDLYLNISTTRYLGLITNLIFMYLLENIFHKEEHFKEHSLELVYSISLWNLIFKIILNLLLDLFLFKHFLSSLFMKLLWFYKIILIIFSINFDFVLSKWDYSKVIWFPFAKILYARFPFNLIMWRRILWIFSIDVFRFLYERPYWEYVFLAFRIKYDTLSKKFG